MNRLLVLVAVLGLGSCGGDPKRETAAPTPTEGEEPNPCGGGDLGGETTADFSDWKQLVKVTDQPIISKGHKDQWVDVYVDSSSADQYRSARGPYSPGARIVKVHYTDEAATTIKFLGVMKKMEPGYDSENSDWYYAKFNETGTEAKMQGKLGKCIGCHSEASDRDYAFGLPE